MDQASQSVNWNCNTEIVLAKCCSRHRRWQCICCRCCAPSKEQTSHNDNDDDDDDAVVLPHFSVRAINSRQVCAVKKISCQINHKHLLRTNHIVCHALDRDSFSLVCVCVCGCECLCCRFGYSPPYAFDGIYSFLSACHIFAFSFAASSTGIYLYAYFMKHISSNHMTRLGQVRTGHHQRHICKIACAMIARASHYPRYLRARNDICYKPIKHQNHKSFSVFC